MRNTCKIWNFGQVSTHLFGKSPLPQFGKTFIISSDSPPDLLAFSITLAMMFVFFFGVKESVAFNHALNVVNVIAWVVIVFVGLFFADFENW